MKRRVLAVTVCAAVLGFALVLVMALRGEPGAVRLPARDEPRSSNVIDEGAAGRGADRGQGAPAERGEVAAAPADPAAEPADRAAAGIHAELLAMTPASRSALLRIAVRDANFPCGTVNTASALPELRLWRVSCAGAHFYMVSVDELQDFHVEPIRWDAPEPAFPGLRNLELVPAPEPNR
jgi:hypothetical protein